MQLFITLRCAINQANTTPFINIRFDPAVTVITLTAALPALTAPRFVTTVDAAPTWGALRRWRKLQRGQPFAVEVPDADTILPACCVERANPLCYTSLQARRQSVGER